MKRIVMIFMTLYITISVFSQQTQNQNHSAEFYLQKAKNQKTTGWILFGTGTVMAVGGLIAFNNSWDNASYTTTDILGYITLAGIVADLVSIPFFISSGHNKKKAATLSIGYQNIYVDHHDFICSGKMPSFILTFKF